MPVAVTLNEGVKAASDGSRQLPQQLGSSALLAGAACGCCAAAAALPGPSQRKAKASSSSAGVPTFPDSQQLRPSLAWIHLVFFGWGEAFIR